MHCTSAADFLIDLEYWQNISSLFLASYQLVVPNRRPSSWPTPKNTSGERFQVWVQTLSNVSDIMWLLTYLALLVKEKFPGEFLISLNVFKHFKNKFYFPNFFS